MCYADGKLILFGGHFYAGDDKFEYLDETWILDIEKLAWHKVACSGQLPAGRYGHSAHIVGSRMFVIGGKGANGAMYNDVFFLDLVEWVWVPVSPLSLGPTPRFFHASTLVGRKVVIHGGWDGDQECFSDLWIFNTDSFSWMQPRTSGFGPTPRYGHSLNLSSDGRLFCFGGCTLTEKGLPKYLDDVRVIDTETMIWTRPRVEGLIVSARYGHTAHMTQNDQIVIFGGWGRGGCQSESSVNDPSAKSCAIFDVPTMTWLMPSQIGKKEVRHLYNHGSALSENTLLIFGGYDGRQATNDFSTVTINV